MRAKEFTFENKLYYKKLNTEQELIEHAKLFERGLSYDNIPRTSRNKYTVVCSTIFSSTTKRLSESKHTTDGRNFVNLIKRLDQFDKLPIKVGSKVSIINSQLQADTLELWGFLEPKTITKIYKEPSDNSIKQFEFNNDPNDIWPRTENAEYNGQVLMYSAFFGDKPSAEQALTMMLLQSSGDLRIRNHITEDTLTEAPLPPDWDKSKFAPNKLGEIDFDEMVAYAKTRAQTLGIGSSRVALVIPYQGRETVLKVAINKSGESQNLAEAKVLSTDWVKQSGMAIPMIDYDEDNPSPLWIHMEKAAPLRERDAKAMFGEHGVFELVHYIRGNQMSKNIIIDEMIRNGWPDAKIEQFLEYTVFIEELDQEFNVRAGDFHQLENWGVYNNMPVIIDLGFTKDVWIKYYGGKNESE
jgi:hypothetical protein